MKKTEKFIVIRSLETGHYLVNYKSNEGAFAYTANWSEDIQDAATSTMEALDRNGYKMQKNSRSVRGRITCSKCNV